MKPPAFQEYTHTQYEHQNSQPGIRINEKIPDDEVLLDNSSSSEDLDNDNQTESYHDIQSEITYESWTPQ